MDKKNERSVNERTVNVLLKNDEQDNDDIIISFSAIFKMLKKFLAFWLIVAILAGILIPVYSVVFAADQHKKLNALVSFNYDGIEKGLAPDGNTFDVFTIKNPAVIEAALTELDIPLTVLEDVRQGISITGVVPADASDKISTYRSIYEQGNLNAGIQMIETDVNPTQYRVSFDYSKAGFNGETAVKFINTMLNKYREYFFELYGFNQALGNAVTALDYSTYDYAQAVDIFNSSLTSLQQYVNQLNQQDQTHFRSSVTGYTFSDLAYAVNTLKNVDLDQLSSYITVNNVTKDRNSLIDYYNYRIEELARKRNVAQEELNQLNESIQNYEKDVVIIYGGDQEASQYTQGSVAYDNMFEKKIAAQNTVSTATQDISMYQQRANALKSKSVADQDKIDKVEKDMAALNVKILALLDKVDKTANEYYETVYLGNAYSVLVPAATSAISTTSSVIKSSMETIIIAEALIFIIYIAVAFILALVSENKKKKVFADPSDQPSDPVDYAENSDS